LREHPHDGPLPGAAAECGAGRPVLEDILRREHVLDDTPELGHGDAASAVATLQSDHPAPVDLVAAYRRAVEAARAHVVDRGIATMPPGEELTVMATPILLRSMLPFAAYDPPGPYDARQVGFHYVTPRDGLDGPELEAALWSHPRASLATTGVHEAYPGHHLQLVSSNRATTLARRVAHIPSGGNILVEGWTFYCEELMERQGFLADPAVRLMRLNDQAWRACRVVIDIELHLGVMDLPAAVDYLSAEAHMNRFEAELECRRYAGEPGQAMSYLLGKREVQRLAAVYGRQRGGSLRDFHDGLLGCGCLPPAVIAWGMGLAPPPPAARVSS
jgi:uncharacterized protein (DUF885 family)